MDDESITKRALEFARANKKYIARKETDTEKYPPDTNPVSVFMAGSPGAGKTESSERLIERLSGDGHSALRIDSDALRHYFDEYTGANSSLFQSATSIIADKIQDVAIEQKQNYIFDSTLSNLERSRENIARCLGHNRIVQILYVYQDPIQAWKFVLKRERVEGRTIPQSAFRQQYFDARRNVNQLKQEFDSQIQVDIILKSIDGTNFMYKENIDVIDSYIPETYTEETLSDALKHL